MDRISPEDDLRYASALLVLRLAPDCTQADAEALARHLHAEHPEVVDVAIRARTDQGPDAA
jgi:hypothetical protein